MISDLIWPTFCFVIFYHAIITYCSNFLCQICPPFIRGPVTNACCCWLQIPQSSNSQNPLIQQHFLDLISFNDSGPIDVWITLCDMNSSQESIKKYYTCSEMRDDRKMYQPPDNISERWSATNCWCTALYGFNISHEDWLMHHTHRTDRLHLKLHLLIIHIGHGAPLIY